MRKTTFTPGPWCLDKDGEVVCCHECGIRVQSIFLPGGKKLANAHLISAAPDLYQVAVEFLKELDRSTRPSYALQMRAKSALAKARGETHPSGGDRHGK